MQSPVVYIATLIVTTLINREINLPNLTLYKANTILKKVFVALCFAPTIMGRTLISIESNNAISEKCFILTEPPSVHRISIELFNLKVCKN